MEATETHPYKLAVLEDGREIVFSTDGQDYFAPVTDEPVWHDAFFYGDVEDFEQLTESVVAAARDISQEEARRLTGYYLPGVDAVVHAWLTLRRVPKDDKSYSIAHAAAVLLHHVTNSFGCTDDYPDKEL